MTTNLVSSAITSRSLTFFALGGSGIRALEPLLHLCALGLGPRQLRVVLIDPDQENAAVTRSRHLLDLYRRAREGMTDGSSSDGYFRTEVIDAIGTTRLWSPVDDGDGVQSQRFKARVDLPLMTGSQAFGAQAFKLLFAERIQDMDLSLGFRGVPSIGTVFMNRLRGAKFFEQLLVGSAGDPNAIFFAAGSIFGGTGAAGMPVVGRALVEGITGAAGATVPGAAPERVGAALLLPYFTLPAPTSASAPDGGIRPEASIFAQNAAAALPMYTGAQARYGSYYVLGDDQPREQQANEVGGKSQDNKGHYVELFAALGALDFAARGGEQRGTDLPVFRTLGIQGRDVTWTDLPLDDASRQRLMGGMVAVHTFLNIFRPDGTASPGMEKAIRGATWMGLLGMTGDDLRRKSGALDDVGQFFRRTWDWLSELTTSDPSLALVTADGRTPTRVPLHQSIQGRRSSEELPATTQTGFEVFRHWNVAASRHRGRSMKGMLDVMREGSESFATERFPQLVALEANRQLRNLLPRLSSYPTPANIPQANVGDWTRITTPKGLSQIDYGAAPADGLRTRIQSIPSPWARMLLFRNAMEDEHHPARLLVQSELLDALQFLWSLDSMTGSRPTFQTLRVAELEALADEARSEHVANFARALVELLPRRDRSRAFESILLVTRDDRPILASSPYTLLFTAEDAQLAGTGQYFKYATTNVPYQALADRPLLFQRYIAQVVAPQLTEMQGTHPDMDWPSVVRLLKPWLQAEVEGCRRKARTAAQQAELSAPINSDWRSAAAQLGLQPLETAPADFELFRGDQAGNLRQSRWALETTRSSGNPPLIIDPAQFNGIYFDGAQAIATPPNLAEHERDVLPGLGVQYPWVNPAADWFTDKILVLHGAVARESVLGYGRFKGEGAQAPRVALPLRPGIFEYFSAEQVEDMLQVEAQPGGRFEVALTIPLQHGGKHVVRRRYDATAVHAAFDGPSLAMWPAFRHENWPAYTLLRLDSGAEAGRFTEIRGYAGGRALESKVEARGNTTHTQSFRVAPEVLEILSTVGGTGSRATPLGVILPRYRQVRAVTTTEWQVGIDFGTSSTVVAIRANDDSSAELLKVEELTLPLTVGTEQSRRVHDAFFFPQSIPAAPFGTAVVRFQNIPEPRLGSEPVGLRVNVPFSGFVEGDESNQVVGDLKWSSDSNRFFLSASFLRHILAVVLTQAIQRGIRPEKVRVTWSHPLSFTQAQTNSLRGLWRNVVESLQQAGLGLSAPTEPIDESRAVLRYFFNAGQANAAGAETAIIDIGGGTSDIALYGKNRVLALDSVILGGRNLTGVRLQARVPENPFVRAFARWAMDNQLSAYPLEQAALKKYLEDKQDHLAFTYLLGTTWFREHGSRFSGTETFRAFQAVVLYFFGALFYYLGLSMRSLHVSGALDGARLPHAVTLAGNGSQYMHWLTDLVPNDGQHAFMEACAALIAAGADHDGRAAGIKLTGEPKREVALGLVAQHDPSLDTTGEGPVQTSVVGEKLLALPGTHGVRAVDATTRMSYEDVVEAERVAELRWDAGKLEIERFHDALLVQSAKLPRYGAHWTASTARLREIFATLDRAEIENITKGRLAYLAKANEGYSGSMFILEVSTILDELLSRSFPAVPESGIGRAGIQPDGARIY
jgi:hypothetical protein